MKGTTIVAVAMWGISAFAAEGAESVASGITPEADARPTWATPRRPVVDVETFAGQKHLSRGSFRALDEQTEAGLRATIARREEDVLRLTVGYLESRARREGDEFAIAAVTREMGLGLVARIRGRHAEATASAGVAMLESELAASYAVRTWSSRERGAGLWYSIGIRTPIGSRATAGVEMRQTIGGVYGGEHSSRANGFHVGATLGLRFGRGSSTVPVSSAWGRS